MKRKEAREKFWDETRPRYDLDFVEVHMPMAELDAFLNEHAKRYVRNNEFNQTYLRDQERHDRLSKKVYMAAKVCLRDRQFKIFMLRYKFGLLETQIAEFAKVQQSEVSRTLQTCHRKIRRALRLEKKPPRQPRRPNKIQPKKKAPKPLKNTTKKS